MKKKEEIIDIFDEKNRRIGTAEKHEAHQKGLWHRTAHVWIHSPNGEILLQLRAKNKSTYPGLWDISAAGHLNAGEEPIDGAVRETEEEIGVKVEKEGFHFDRVRRFSCPIGDLQNNEFCYVYFIELSSTIRMTRQKSEVAALKFVPIDEIEEECREHPERFVPHSEYWTEIFSEVRRRITASKNAHR